MTHLKVAVRVRPLSHREIEGKSSSVLTIENAKTISITNTKVPEQNVGDSRERIRRFTFDFCFDQDATQESVFEAVEDVVGRALKRRNHSCVLAYGQSSSGKTHTMMGFPHDPGLTPRLCRKVFGYLQETAVGDEIETSKTSVSFLEIYNEKVRDLLGGQHAGKVALKVRHHPKKGPYVQGLSEHYVDDADGLLHLLQVGDGARKVSSTLTNPQSSRSHAVFIVNCGGVKLTLVDLAGSERAANTNSYSACTFREGANINKSLVALGNVISALAEQASTRRRFIPFRDSILTWLLRDTLGGSSDTVMIATVSPSSACFSETVNTLRFGQRAKLIVTAPVVNEDPREKTIRELRAEIARLKELINRLPTSPQKQPEPEMEPQEDTSMSSQGLPKAPSPSAPQEQISERKLDKLIPVMSVTCTQNAKLRRTFSVEHNLAKGANSARKFGSAEAIRRPSIKHEKVTGSDSKAFVNVSPKVDSIRKVPIKSKSQIVAAVTHRLYAKTKRKEVATDTSDLPKLAVVNPPKELQICSNARLKLKELTKRALKAHRNRNVETQTDLFPVRRVKEIATDVSDLGIDLNRLRNIETCTDLVQTCDKAIECGSLESFSDFDKFKGDHGKFLVTTRSCGTQFSCNNLSFTKYLLGNNKHQPPIFNMNGANNDSVDCGSDDSLDLNRDLNLCFPTPDLISNHNSLEPNHANVIVTQNEKITQLVNATQSEILQLFQLSTDFTVRFDHQVIASKSSLVPSRAEKVANVNIPVVFAPQLCANNLNPERCRNLPNLFSTNLWAKARLVDVRKTYFEDDCVKISEPLVLKSIMKHFPAEPEEDREIPDSLEYHLANNSKKVRFDSENNKRGRNKSGSDRIVKVMSGFLEEATILMSNLSTTVAKFDSVRHFNHLEDFDLQVTVNDISGLNLPASLGGCVKKRIKDANSQTDSSFSRRNNCKDCGTQSSRNRFNYDAIPTTTTFNKYEILLEDSCRRLEEKINKTPTANNSANSELLLSPDDFYNPWDLSGANNQDYYNNNNDDGSLESNPVTFSDYGSLPRRPKSRNHRHSPSAYLRQLTSMRKQVVENSREELFQSHHSNDS